MRSSENILKMIVKMLTHMYMVLFTWCCWHICKGEGVGVGVDVDQLVGKRSDGRTVRPCWADGPAMLGGQSASLILFHPERLFLWLGLKGWIADGPTKWCGRSAGHLKN